MLAKCCLLTGKVRKYIIEETNFLWILENANKFCWTFQIRIFEVLLNFPDLNICFSLSRFSSFDSSLKVSLSLLCHRTGTVRKLILLIDVWVLHDKFFHPLDIFYFTCFWIFWSFSHRIWKFRSFIFGKFWGMVMGYPKGFWILFLHTFNPYSLNASVWSLLHSITRLNCH